MIDRAFVQAAINDASDPPELFTNAGHGEAQVAATSQDRTIVRSRPVRVRLDVLDKLELGRSKALRLNLFSDMFIDIVVKKIKKRSEKVWTFPVSQISPSTAPASTDAS